MSNSSKLILIVIVSLIGATLFILENINTPKSETSSNIITENTESLKQIHNIKGLQLEMPRAFAEIECSDIEESRKVIEFNLTGESVDLPILGHTTEVSKTYKAMTFDQQVPGPTLRVKQGDVVKVTLTIPEDEPMTHGIYAHSSQNSMIDKIEETPVDTVSFRAVHPGTSKTFCYIAHVPGIFSYHANGINLVAMDQHVLSGMYGITIVDPANGYKKLMVEKTSGSGELDRKFYSADALEFQLQFSQLYLMDDGNYDPVSMIKHHHSQSTVNGMAFGYTSNEEITQLLGTTNVNIFPFKPWNSPDLNQYQSKLLYVPTETHVRLFVENQGNEPLFFNIEGEILDRVSQGGKIKAEGIESWFIGGSQGAIIDVVFDDPGVYFIQNHDYAQMVSGAVSVIVAGDPFGFNISSYAELLGNPCDAVPPQGQNSIAHPNINLHGLYTDKHSKEICGTLQKITFVSSKGTGWANSRMEVYTMNMDGTELKRLTTNEYIESSPVWSPDGKRIAFDRNVDDDYSDAIIGFTDIYVMDVNDLQITKLTNSGYAGNPDWSPDGEKIVFNDFDGLNQQIYVINATDGSNKKQLTFNSYLDWHPTFSPDGEMIAFQSYRENDWDIFIMNSNGSGEENISRHPDAHDRSPDWSPDGQKIVFESEYTSPDNFEIWVSNLSGTQLERLTVSEGDDLEPNWYPYPKEDKIVFVSSREWDPTEYYLETWDIFIMNSDGNEVTNLTNSPFIDDREPTWEP